MDKASRSREVWQRLTEQASLNLFLFFLCLYFALFILYLYGSSFCFALLCFALLCFALLCFALLRFASLCFALLCCASLCFALFGFSLCLVFALLCSALRRFALWHFAAIFLFSRLFVRLCLCYCRSSFVCWCVSFFSFVAFRLVCFSVCSCLAYTLSALHMAIASCPPPELVARYH